MKRIIDIFAEFVAFFYCVKLNDKLKSLKEIFYSKIIAKSFAKVGANPHFEPKLFIHGGENIFIGDNIYCYHSVRIEAYSRHNNNTFSPTIIIGDNVGINPYCHIGAINKITIGNNVMLASGVFITDHYHGLTNVLSDLVEPVRNRKLVSKGVVVIEDNVWLGENVAVMPGVTIGRNSIVGANSVVTKDIPWDSIVGGVPARIIKKF